MGVEPGSSGGGNNQPPGNGQISVEQLRALLAGGFAEELLANSKVIQDLHNRLVAQESQTQEIKTALGSIVASLDGLAKGIETAQQTAAVAPAGGGNDVALQTMLLNAGNFLLSKLTAGPPPPPVGVGLSQAAGQLLEVGQVFVTLMATLDRMRSQAFAFRPPGAAEPPSAPAPAEPAPSLAEG